MPVCFSVIPDGALVWISRRQLEGATGKINHMLHASLPLASMDRILLCAYQHDPLPFLDR